MTEDEIFAQLNDIFRDILDDDDIVLTRQTTAADLKEWDSANHINIVVSVETRFKLKFSNADIEHLKNVGDFVSLIEAKQRAKARV